MQDIIIPQPGSIIWTACVFIVLLFVLRKWAWGPIIKGLQTRENGIRKDIEDARQSNLDAQELLEKYQKQLDDARKESQKLVNDANARAEQLYEEKKQEAGVNAQAMIEKAKSEIELERQKAAEELRQQVVEIAITAASKVIGHALNPEDHRSLIDDEIDRLN